MYLRLKLLLELTEKKSPFETFQMLQRVKPDEVVWLKIIPWESHDRNKTIFEKDVSERYFSYEITNKHHIDVGELVLSEEFMSDLVIKDLLLKANEEFIEHGSSKTDLSKVLGGKKYEDGKAVESEGKFKKFQVQVDIYKNSNLRLEDHEFPRILTNEKKLYFDGCGLSFMEMKNQEGGQSLRQQRFEKLNIENCNFFMESKEHKKLFEFWSLNKVGKSFLSHIVQSQLYFREPAMPGCNQEIFIYLVIRPDAELIKRYSIQTSSFWEFRIDLQFDRVNVEKLKDSINFNLQLCKGLPLTHYYVPLFDYRTNYIKGRWKRCNEFFLPNSIDPVLRLFISNSLILRFNINRAETKSPSFISLCKLIESTKKLSNSDEEALRSSELRNSPYLIKKFDSEQFFKFLDKLCPDRAWLWYIFSNISNGNMTIDTFGKFLDELKTASKEKKVNSDMLSKTLKYLSDVFAEKGRQFVVEEFKKELARVEKSKAQPPNVLAPTMQETTMFKFKKVILTPSGTFYWGEDLLPTCAFFRENINSGILNDIVIVEIRDNTFERINYQMGSIFWTNIKNSVIQMKLLDEKYAFFCTSAIMIKNNTFLALPKHPSMSESQLVTKYFYPFDKIPYPSVLNIIMDIKLRRSRFMEQKNIIFYKDRGDSSSPNFRYISASERFFSSLSKRYFYFEKINFLEVNVGLRSYMIMQDSSIDLESNKIIVPQAFFDKLAANTHEIGQDVLKGELQVNYFNVSTFKHGYLNSKIIALMLSMRTVVGRKEDNMPVKRDEGVKNVILRSVKNFLEKVLELKKLLVERLSNVQQFPSQIKQWWYFPALSFKSTDEIENEYNNNILRNLIIKSKHQNFEKNKDYGFEDLFLTRLQKMLILDAYKKLKFKSKYLLFHSGFFNAIPDSNGVLKKGEVIITYCFEDTNIIEVSPENQFETVILINPNSLDYHSISIYYTKSFEDYPDELKKKIPRNCIVYSKEDEEEFLYFFGGSRIKSSQIFACWDKHFQLDKEEAYYFRNEIYPRKQKTKIQQGVNTLQTFQGVFSVLEEINFNSYYYLKQKIPYNREIRIMEPISPEQAESALQSKNISLTSHVNMRMLKDFIIFLAKRFKKNVLYCDYLDKKSFREELENWRKNQPAESNKYDIYFYLVAKYLFYDPEKNYSKKIFTEKEFALAWKLFLIAKFHYEDARTPRQKAYSAPILVDMKEFQQRYDLSNYLVQHRDKEQDRKVTELFEKNANKLGTIFSMFRTFDDFIIFIDTVRDDLLKSINNKIKTKLQWDLYLDNFINSISIPKPEVIEKEFMNSCEKWWQANENSQEFAMFYNKSVEFSETGEFPHSEYQTVKFRKHYNENYPRNNEKKVWHSRLTEILQSDEIELNHSKIKISEEIEKIEREIKGGFIQEYLDEDFMIGKKKYKDHSHMEFAMMLLFEYYAHIKKILSTLGASFEEELFVGFLIDKSKFRAKNLYEKFSRLSGFHLSQLLRKLRGVVLKSFPAVTQSDFKDQVDPPHSEEIKFLAASIYLVTYYFAGVRENLNSFPSHDYFATEHYKVREKAILEMESRKFLGLPWLLVSDVLIKMKREKLDFMPKKV